MSSETLTELAHTIADSGESPGFSRMLSNAFLDLQSQIDGLRNEKSTNCERFCCVCGEQIHGKRDRIFAVLPDGTQIQIVAMPVLNTPADLCMECIRDVVKNRKFTRTKAVPDAGA